MPRFVHNVSNLIRRVLFLARPYGRAKLAGVFSLALTQAVFQVIGATSIFPFLAVAADPDRIRRSHFGTVFLSLFPPMGNLQLLIVTGVIAIVGVLFSNAINLLAEYARTRYAANFAHWLRVRLLTRVRREVHEKLRTHPIGYYREAHQMLGGNKPVKVPRAEEHFLARFAGHSAIIAKMSALVSIFNSARYVVEPLAFGGLVVAVLLLAAKGRDFSDILPNLGVMALAGYRLLPSIQLLYSQLTQVSSMRHAMDEVYDEFVEAEPDGSVSPAISR